MPTKKETIKKDKPSEKQASESLEVEPSGLDIRPGTSFDSSANQSSHQREESASGSAIACSDIPEITVEGAASASPPKHSKSLKQSIAKKLSPSSKKKIAASPKKNVEASPKKSIDSSPRKSIDSSPRKSIDASESPRKSGLSVKGAMVGAVSSIKGAATSFKDVIVDAATSIKGAVKRYPQSPEKASLVNIESECQPPRAKSKKAETECYLAIETFIEPKQSPMTSGSPTESTSLPSSQLQSPSGSETSSEVLSPSDSNKSPEKSCSKPSLLD